MASSTEPTFDAIRIGIVSVSDRASSGVYEDKGLPALNVSPAPGGGQNYSLSLQVVLMMTALTLLPAGLLREPWPRASRVPDRKSVV